MPKRNNILSILIEILELLERHLLRKTQKKRPLTKWQKHLQEYLRDGKSIQEAASIWKLIKLGQIVAKEKRRK